MFRVVFGETMEWGFHPAMVDEVDIIQGREHIKGMVVMVGESIELECQVGFTNQNVSHIIWKVDGKTQNKTSLQIEESKKGEVFIKDHFKLSNIDEVMDGSTISCEYSKGYYGGSVEVNLRVYKLNIELTEEVCYAKEGEAKLSFTRCKKTSPSDENIKSKIVSRIVKMTNGTVQIQNSSQYSVLMPLESVLKSKGGNFT